MRVARTVFVAFLLVAIVVLTVVLVVQLGKSRQGTEGQTPVVVATSPPAGSIVVEVHSSNTKQDWMEQVAATFNAAGYTIDGKPVVVTLKHVGSGTSMADILDGKDKPVVWSPGS